jgi:hypothetical protein
MVIVEKHHRWICVGSLTLPRFEFNRPPGLRTMPTDNTAAPSISQAITTSTTTTMTSPPGVVRYPDVDYGIHIEALAAYFGIAPANVALGMTGVMTSIAGPYAGLVDPMGIRNPLHLNLLSVDCGTPRFEAMEKALFQPLAARADYLRLRANSQSRQLADRCVFGDHGLNPTALIRRPIYAEFNGKDENNAVNQMTLAKNGSLPTECFDERQLSSLKSYWEEEGLRSSPGASHLPSLFFSHEPLDMLGQMMKESIHREAFLIHPKASIFGSRASFTGKGDKQASTLAAYLQGTDVQFPPIHADQGYGTFERARVHLWASTSRQCVGAILNDPSSGWNDVLEQCLLWEAPPWSGTAPNMRAVAMASKSYDAALNRLLNARCFGKMQDQMRLTLPNETAVLFSTRQTAYLDTLAKIQAANKCNTAQFHDLPARLLWMFFQLSEVGKFTLDLNTVFKTALYAVRMHVRLLKQARESHAEQAATAAMNQITWILTRKGPCKLRDIQRSCNNQRADNFKPAIQLLEQKGHLKMDEKNRYMLVPGLT